MADLASVLKWIIQAYARNKTTSEIAAVFGRCPADVRRVRQQMKKRGDELPQFHLRGSRGIITPECQAKLRERVTQKPDQTIDELRQRFEEELNFKVFKSTNARVEK